MIMNLEELGITKEDLQERVIERCCEMLLSEVSYDENESPRIISSSFERKAKEQIKKIIDEKVTEAGDKHVLPFVAKMIENTVLQKTNEWGEKTGTPISFIEYLVQRAEVYMTQQVDYKGEEKTNSNSYNWSGRSTRVAYMINKHLHYAIETAMKKALANANSQIAKGIEEAIKVNMELVLKNVKCAVTV